MTVSKKSLIGLCNLLGIKQVSSKNKDELKALIKKHKELKNVNIIHQDPVKNIKYVYHSADLHIRTLERHHEYQQVFDNLYNYLKTQNCKEDSVFVISGDIFHNRDKLVSECILVFNKFIENLTKIIDVVMIVGNHDTFTHGDRLDTISGITEIKEFKNFHFLKNSGIYKYNNIDFVVSSLVDNKFINYEMLVNSRSDSILPENNRNISLFHGAISGCKLDNGQILPDSLDTLKLSDLKGFDFVLLGDIHKHQFLTPSIAYPGSLIQQNHKEDRDHGILKWDIISRSSEFVKIENEYGYITIDIKGGIIPDIEFPMKSRIRIRHPYTEEIDIDNLKKQLSEKTTIVSLSKELLPISQNSDGVVPVINIKEKSEMEIFDNLTSKFSKEMKKDLIELHLDYQNKFDNRTGKGSDVLPWKLNYMEFRDIFIYGGGILNRVDFTPGIIGILGRNASGKSSLLNTIFYSLFGNVFKIKNFSNRNVINRHSKTMSLKLAISMGNFQFIIEKEGKCKTRKGGAIGMEETVVFKKIDEDGIITNLSGSNKVDTVSIIYSTLGLTTKENFMLTNVMSYTNYISLLSLSSGDISKILGELFDLQKYKDIYSDSLKKVKVFSDKIKGLQENKENLLEERVLIPEETLLDYEDQLKQYESELKITGYSLEELIESKNEFRNFAEADFDQNLLEKEKDFIKIIQENTEEVKNYGDLNEMPISYLEKLHGSIIVKGTSKELISWNEAEIDSLRDEIYLLKNNLVVPKEIHSEKLYKLALKKIKDEISPDEFIRDLKETKKIGKDHIVDEDLFLDLIDYLESLRSISGETLKNKMIILEYNKFLEDQIKFKEESVILKEKESLLNKLFFSKKKTINSIIKIKTTKFYLEKIEKYKSNQTNIKKLEEISGTIARLKEARTHIASNILRINILITTVKMQIQEYSRIQSKLIILDEKIVKLKIEETLYKYYKDILCDKGLPKLVLRDKIKKVEMECNILCYKIIGLTINLDTYEDDESKYEITAKKNGAIIGIDQISGFEKFVVNIALKLALDKFKCQSGAKLFCIDEAFDCISSENFDKVDDIFDFLKGYYSTVLIVSHNEDLKKKIDKRIEIDVGEKYSSIKM